MKQFEVKRTIFHPYSPKDELIISNDDYNLEISVNNDCCESFATLELECITSLFNGISHMELELREDNILNIHTDGFSGEVHLPINRIELKDLDNNTIFRINVVHEEGSLTQPVHIIMATKNN